MLNYDVEVFEDNSGYLSVHCTDGSSHRFAFFALSPDPGTLYEDIKDAALNGIGGWDIDDTLEGDEALKARDVFDELCSRPDAAKLVASVIDGEIAIHLSRMGGAALRYAGFD